MHTLGDFFGILFTLKLTGKEIHVHRICDFPKMGDGRRGRVWKGGGILPRYRVFAFSGFKKSDLVHNLDDFIGILSIHKNQ